VRLFRFCLANMFFCLPQPVTDRQGTWGNQK
jgi:hypothetical protein